MSGADLSRRSFLSAATALAGGAVLSGRTGLGLMAEETKADYSLRIATQPIELAPKRIVSVTAYNGQFPGPLLRFREGVAVSVDVHNDTDTPEQLHWHGQSIPADVDGAGEEGTPFIPPHGSTRISFVPVPPDSASTILTYAPVRTSASASTAVWLVRSISNRRMTRANTTAKCSLL